MAEGSERAAEALRENAPRLDDIARARMEKRLVESLSSPDVAKGTVPFETSGRRGASGRVPYATAGVLAVAAAVGVVFWWGSGAPETPDAVAATFQTYEEGETVRRGAFAAGETVRTEEGQRVEVRVTDARVDVTPATAARFVRFDADAVHVAVERGAIEVEFHPQRRGEQSLLVSTPAARVEVVGTVFRVEVDDEATTVRVTEGVVRVTPTRGGEARMVRAGEATRVSVEPEPEEVEQRAQELVVPSETLPPTTTAQTRRAAGPREAAPSAMETSAADAIEGEAEATALETIETAEGIDAPAVPEPRPELSLDARFDLAEHHFNRGQMEQARHVLHGIIRSPVRRSHRSRAWTTIAESYQRESNWRDAAEAYRRAAEAGGATVHGRNALYAWAYTLDRRLGDTSAALAAYRRYIDQDEQAQARGGTPSPHLHLCRQRLCQLGDRAHCAPE